MTAGRREGQVREQGAGLTRVVGDVGLCQVAAGDQGWLGLAKVLDELGFGYGRQHRAGALLHTGVCEQLGGGAPIGVPHLVAQLRIEASIAAEGRGGSRASGRQQDPCKQGVRLACQPRARYPTSSTEWGLQQHLPYWGVGGLNGQHTEKRPGP